VLVGAVMGGLAFVFFLKMGVSPFMGLVVGGVFLAISYFMLTKSVDAKITKRQKQIDRDVLFAGRFLLIKLNSGKPLIMSLMEASQSYGVASHYFKEIVRNIELGTPLEETLEQAVDTCPSQKMKRIIFQINSALKAGIDATKNLEAVLDEISNSQLVEIQRYGKKLNGITLFYMLAAVVMPSLGITLFIIIASLVGMTVPASVFFSFIVFIMVIEMVFITVFKAIRPSVNI
jgi:pilus assembly protein TadC